MRSQLDMITFWWYFLLDLFSFGKHYPYFCRLYVKTSNFYTARDLRFRIEEKDNGKVVVFSNGWVFDMPQSVIEYYLVNNKYTSNIVTDGDSIWFMRIDKDGLVPEIFQNNLLQKTIIYQTLNFAKSKFDNARETRNMLAKLQLLTGGIMVIGFIVFLLMSNNISEVMKRYSESLDEFKKYNLNKDAELRMNAIDYAYRYNVSFPELGVYYDNITKKVYIKEPNGSVTFVQSKKDGLFPEIPLFS